MRRKAQPLVIKLPVSAKQLYTGAKLRFIVNKRVECDERSCTSGYESYEVEIQPGTRNGEEILIEDGFNEYTNADASDIVFRVMEIPSPGFERNGLNLIYRMSISLKEVSIFELGTSRL